MKICSKCNVQKTLSSFYVKDSRTGRLHAQCKECYKIYRRSHYSEYYQAHRESYRKRSREARAQARLEFRTNMLRYLKDKSCEICEESDIRTFEFDHINPELKLFSISQSARLGYSWEKTVLEIKKCRILCANCHKKHTATQASWYKI